MKSPSNNLDSQETFLSTPKRKGIMGVAGISIMAALAANAIYNPVSPK
jgi:hypothetical protein